MTLIGKQHTWQLLRSKSIATVAVSIWMMDVEKSQWSCRDDILLTYPSARFITPNMVIFTFASSQIEITAQIAFNTSVVVILAAALSAAATAIKIN